MRFKIDLKIFLFILLFYFTNQIETYVLMIVFAIVHELGHLLTGLIMGMKPEKIEIKPYGLSISFKVIPMDYNQKYVKGNLLEIKKIIVALAGPITNLLIIVIASWLKLEIFTKMMIIYANTLLIIFNLIPIYPLDGGRVLKSLLHIAVGKRKSEIYSNNISFVFLMILTFIASIGIIYFKNIAIFFIIIVLWGLYLKEDLVYKRKNRIYNLIEKTIEIDTN